MDMEVSIPPYPVLTVHAQPPSAMDTKVRRVLDKQFRAAGWSAKRVEWMSPTTSPSASGPVLHVSCEGSATARELVLVMRIGLAHFVAGTRAALPTWEISFDARGADGILRLVWDRGAAPKDMVESLMGLVPQPQPHLSEGRRFWAERDGGVSALSPGTWNWDLRSRAWRTGEGPKD